MRSFSPISSFSDESEERNPFARRLSSYRTFLSVVGGCRHMGAASELANTAPSNTRIRFSRSEKNIVTLSVVDDVQECVYRLLPTWQQSYREANKKTTLGMSTFYMYMTAVEVEGRKKTTKRKRVTIKHATNRSAMGSRERFYDFSRTRQIGFGT